MINKNLTKRIISSVILLLLLFLMFISSFVMFVSLILISLMAWIEFNRLFLRIFSKKDFKYKLFFFLSSSLTFAYLFVFVFIIFFIESSGLDFALYKFFIFYFLIISISSDIGGYVFGNIFKGKKLTKISPNKTISGSIGSFIFSLIMIPLFLSEINLILNNINLYLLIVVTFFVSLITQLGDLFVSYLKRLASVKNTGTILPGHGGVLDRIDGILFAIPGGIIMLDLLI